MQISKTSPQPSPSSNASEPDASGRDVERCAAVPASSERGLSPIEATTRSTEIIRPDPNRLAYAVGTLAAHLGANIDEMKEGVQRFGGEGRICDNDVASEAAELVKNTQYTTAYRFQNNRDDNLPRFDLGSGAEMSARHAMLFANAPAQLDGFDLDDLPGLEQALDSQEARTDVFGHAIADRPTAPRALHQIAASKAAQLFSPEGRPYVSLTTDVGKFIESPDPSAQDIVTGCNEIHTYTVPNRMLSDTAKIHAEFERNSSLPGKLKDEQEQFFKSHAKEGTLSSFEREIIFAGNNLDHYHEGQEQNPYQTGGAEPAIED